MAGRPLVASSHRFLLPGGSGGNCRWAGIAEEDSQSTCRRIAGLGLAVLCWGTGICGAIGGDGGSGFVVRRSWGATAADWATDTGDGGSDSDAGREVRVRAEVRVKAEVKVTVTATATARSVTLWVCCLACRCFDSPWTRWVAVVANHSLTKARVCAPMLWWPLLFPHQSSTCNKAVVKCSHRLYEQYIACP